MHSYDWQGPGNIGVEGQEEVNVTFHHNGDYSGEVKINVPSWYGEPSLRHFTLSGEDQHIAELSVPFEALEQLVLNKWRTDIVAWAEGEEEDPKKIALVNAIINCLVER